MNTFVASTTSAFLFLAPFTGSAGVRATLLVATALAMAWTWRTQAAPFAARVPRGITLAFAAWALCGVASLAWSVDPRYSLGELRHEVLYPALTLAIFFLAAQQGPHRWRPWCTALLVASVLVFAQHMLQEHFGIAFTRHPASEQRGPWSTHLVLIAPLVLALGWRAPWGGHRHVALALAGTGLLLLAAWETENRMVWVALAVQFLLAASLRPAAANGGTRTLRWMAVAAAALATVALSASIADRSAWQFAGAADSLERDVRPRIWGVAWDKFREAPVLGHGFGREILWADFAPHTPKVLEHPQIRHGHNLFVDRALETGLVGLAAFVALLALLAWEYRGYLRTPALAPLGVMGLMVLAGFIVKCSTDDFLHRHNGLVFWALNAMLVGLARGERARGEATPRAEAAAPS